MRQALLQDILDHPDDDAARLVYADWLEEMEGEQQRAQFIREGVRIARATDWKDSISLDEITGGAFFDWFGSYPLSWLRAWPGTPQAIPKRLIKTAAVDWEVSDGNPRPQFQGVFLEGYGDSPVGSIFTGVQRSPTWTFTVRRGFVERVVWPMEAWMHYGPGFVLHQPITRVEISNLSPAPVGWRPGIVDYWEWSVEGAIGVLVSNAVPRPIWERLGPYVKGAYRKKEDAVNALSVACLLYAHNCPVEEQANPFAQNSS